MKFKIGDMVKCTNDEKYSHIKKGQTFEVLGINSDDNIEIYNNVGSTADYRSSHFKLASKGKVPIKYLVYGTGCDNESTLLNTFKEATAYAKRKAKDSSWTGRIIIYELTPKSEAEVKTVFKVFKKTDIKKL